MSRPVRVNLWFLGLFFGLGALFGCGVAVYELQGQFPWGAAVLGMALYIPTQLYARKLGKKWGLDMEALQAPFKEFLDQKNNEEESKQEVV